MALPALTLAWLMVASVPAVKYKASARIESVVRTPLLTEQAASPVVSDLMMAPRLEGELYTALLNVKFAFEGQLFVRQAVQKPTLESLESVYARAEYKPRRDLTLIGLHTTTYGNFPLEQFAGAGGSSLPISPGAKSLGTSAYIYSETLAGFLTTLGIKRLNISGTLGWIVNGLLFDPPVRPLKRGDAAYPQQRFPELRAQANYTVTPRDYLSLVLYGRDVSFSTGNRDALLQLGPGIQHVFSPLVDGRLESGLALTRVYPRRPDESPINGMQPYAEASITAPVPLGNHWPVLAKLRARYLPYMDPLTTQLIPRGDVGLDLEWKGRRENRILGKLRYAQALTEGIHRHDAEARAEVEALYPLPLSRYLYMQTKGQLTWTRHVVLSSSPIVQWFTSVGLVVRYDRGRL